MHSALPHDAGVNSVREMNGSSCAWMMQWVASLCA